MIIIGAGPAGITAAIYASRKKISTLVISRDIGGQAALSGDIENYTGYQFITGPELSQKFEEHLRKFKIDLKENESVEQISKEADIILVKTDKGSYKGKSLIIASGKRSKELGVEGEKEFKNKGLTYCATCDGPLFSGKDVAVIGGGNSALDAAIQLERIANKVYIINIAEDLTGDPVLREIIKNNPRFIVFNNTQVSRISGDKMLKSISVKNKGRERPLDAQGVFVEIGLIPNSEFIKDVEKNELGEIKVNPLNETSVKGIFAAGDVTDVPEKQIVIAAGEGSKAALSVFKYLIIRRK